LQGTSTDGREDAFARGTQGSEAYGEDATGTFSNLSEGGIHVLSKVVSPWELSRDDRESGDHQRITYKRRG